MKVPTKIQSLLLATATSLILSACGSNGVTGTPGAATYGQNEIPTASIPTISGDSAAYPFSFSTYGTTPSTVTTALRTDTKLLVKVTADAATRNQGTPVYTNFAAEYHCAVFRVTLQMDIGNGTYTDLGSVVTSSLKVAGTPGCTGSVDSQTINFSAFMTPGHGNIKIKVESLKTDFYCIIYNKCVAFKNQYGFWSSDCVWASPSNMASYACPTKTIYQYHTVNGALEVQVNGTSFVN